ncbi:hypothetical protein WICMUC_001464 [Wickerhamomyces mucosus]|uniref:Uncharacterized protein n=1 Tax=Wickerhamomyces mucosus TaxID=1378264 RepID=A0A9P8PVN6_9ASCO|nr:hypothetical protein WICMUC_001464 [Wickerhamomyces mucosus]
MFPSINGNQWAIQAQPEPWIPANLVLVKPINFSTEPYCELMAFNNSPVGNSPPPWETGAKFFQNKAWFLKPPPWNLICCSNSTVFKTSPLAVASSCCSIAVL